MRSASVDWDSLNWIVNEVCLCFTSLGTLSLISYIEWMAILMRYFMHYDCPGHHSNALAEGAFLPF